MTNTAAGVRFVGRDIYYGWVVLGVAALAMVGTLPGRTQGLGLITEPLLADLGVSRVQFAQINSRRHTDRRALRSASARWSIGAAAAWCSRRWRCCSAASWWR